MAIVPGCKRRSRSEFSPSTAHAPLPWGFHEPTPEERNKGSEPSVFGASLRAKGYLQLSYLKL